MQVIPFRQGLTSHRSFIWLLALAADDARLARADATPTPRTISSSAFFFFLYNDSKYLKSAQILF
jgi:hypothetical protein